MQEKNNMNRKIAIIGGGTLGRAVEKHAQKRGVDTVTVKDIQQFDQNIIPDDVTDVIVTAQSVSIQHDLEDDNLHFVNTELPLKAAKEAVRKGIQSIAFFSTGSVYGTGNPPPAKETDIIDSTQLHP